MNRPKCFISYSSDTEGHIRWVKKLASRLSQENTNVILDKQYLKYGQDLPNFMESSIRDSDFVLLVCTPSFALKSNKGEGGVGYEKMIVTGEIFQGISAPDKFIPILREGDKKDAIPSYLKSKTYIDFRNDENFEANFTELYQHIFGNSEHARPNTQMKQTYPSSANQRTKQNHASSKADIIKDLISYASGGPFALAIFGLGMSQSEAADFAVRIYKLIPSERIDDFKKIVSFAKVQVFKSPFGSDLDMTTHNAIEFAIKTIKEIPHEEIDEYMNLIRYARQMQPIGLGKSQSEAIGYALEIVKRI